MKIGSIWLLSELPWWIVVLAVCATSGIALAIRWLTEKEFYNKSLAAIPGDLFLALYCGIVAYICQNNKLEYLLQLYAWHLATFILCILVSIGLHITALTNESSRRFTMLPAQWYHNLFVVPLLSYVIISTLPIVFSATLANLCALFCLVIWTALLMWDIWHDNLIQKR